MNRVNVPIAILSLAISILLWLVVFSQGARPMLTREYVVRLTPDAVKNERWAITKIPDSIRIQVTAPENRFARLNPEQFVALVDLSKATAGARSYPVQIFPAALRELVSAGPMSVAVEIEPVADASFPVIIDTKGELDDSSLTLQALVTDPVRARVTGARSAVETVRRIRGFLDLGEASIGPGGAADVQLEALDDRGRVIDRVRTEPLFARVRLVLAAAPSEKQVLVAPTFRGAPAPGYVPASYSLTPTQLAVRGGSATLAGTSRVFTDPIDLTGLTTDRTFDVVVRLPKGVRAIGPGRVRVTVRIRRGTGIVSPTNEAATNEPRTNGARANGPVAESPATSPNGAANAAPNAAGASESANR